MMRAKRSWVFLTMVVGSASAFAACSDDVDDLHLGSVDASADVTVQHDGGVTDAAPDTSATASIARGKYIVDVLANCGDCHTPRKPDGSPDTTRYLAGVDCFAGTDHSDGGGGAGPGCLNSRNLTSDVTGLKNRTDQQIRDMFQNGQRPNGEYLHPFMPYWMFHNMTDDDANSVVAYLRTVPAVAHEVKPSQPPWNNVTAPAPPIDMNTVPQPSAGTANLDSAKRGRYLAAVTAGCIDCHTPETSLGSGQLDRSRWFAGNRVFPAAQIGLPSPPFPSIIYSANLTQDPTGLAGYTTQDVVNEIKQGKDKDGGAICPPMPVGPRGGYGGMTDGDALDIATYVLSLPPIANQRTANCVAPAP